MKWQEENLDVYKFNIDVTENDVHQCKEVLPIKIYLAGYCCCSITSLTKVSKWAVNTTLTEILVLTSTSAKECYPRIHRLSLFSLPFSLLFPLALALPLANQRR